MENNQFNDPFDAMLKQSLEGAKMQAPAGAWEAIGSSIGAKAIIATKIAGIKLILLKSVAAIVIAGGAAWGVYEIFQSDNKIEIKGQPSQVSVTGETASGANTTASDNNLSSGDKRSNSNEGLPLPVDRSTGAEDLFPIKTIKTTQDTFKSTLNKEETPTHKDVKSQEPAVKKETPDNIIPEKKNTPSTTEEKKEPVSVFNNVIIPDIFTPDGDGYNDCYKIIIENEIKFSLQIFDYAGSKVFEATDKNNCWDGKNMSSGQICARGFYTYRLFYELKTGFHRRATGELTLW